MSLSPFGSIPVGKKGRTNFDLSHSVSGTFALSYAQPVFMTETIPGDRFDINVFNLSKLETLIVPALQRIDASLLWFKIPKRLCFNRFKDWYSGGADGQTDAEKPHWDLREILDEFTTITANIENISERRFIAQQVFGPGSLWNYFGLPAFIENKDGVWQMIDPQGYVPGDLADDDSFIDAMPFIAYWLLHDEYFMDQTLGKRMFTSESDLKIGDIECPIMLLDGTVKTSYNAESVPVADGGKLSVDSFFVLNQMFKRAWRKDYFTSALPTPQRGPEVSLDMFQDAKLDVEYDEDHEMKITVPDMEEGDTYSGNLTVGRISEEYPEDIVRLNKVGTQLNAPVNLEPVPGQVDLSGLSPITISAFRNLFKLQAFLEKNNVAGGRFIETILAHWAERVPDFTVQRPVHVRSTSIPIQISEVTATANSSGFNSQLGDQAGRARTQGNLGRVHIYTQEPCFIIALYTVTVPPAYIKQGIDRMWQRKTRFDEPWTDFQHIGEQAIKNRELYLDVSRKSGDHSYNDLDFGYQQRFSEFKYMPDRVVGDLCTSMSYWTMARAFNLSPYLNEDFVTHQPDQRIFAVQNARQVIADFYFSIRAKRKLSRFSTPKLT